MMFLTFQTALLLLAAYVLGAMVGCWLHRMLAAPIGVDLVAAGAAIPEQPMIETATGPAPDVENLSHANRFERALVGTRPKSADGPTQEEPPPVIEVGEPLPRVAPAASTIPPYEPPTTPAPVQHHGEGLPSLPAAGSTGGVTGASAPLAPATTQSPDDLTRIFAIDQETAARLAELGMASYARLAALTRADIDRVEATLGQHRISREGWIEQAKLLASGHETAYARRLAGKEETRPTSAEIYREGQGPEIDSSVATHDAPKESTEPETTVAAVVEESHEDSIDTEQASEPLVEEAEAATTQTEVAENRAAADELAAIMTAAAALARSQTHMGEDQSGDETVTTESAPIIEAEPDESTVQAHSPEFDESSDGTVSQTLIEEPPAEPDVGQAADDIDPFATPAPVDEPAHTAADDLLRIRGVDADAIAILQANGVNRFEQISNWHPAEVRRFEGLIGPVGRIRQENWIEQAQILAKGGETAFSRRQRLEPQTVAHEPPQFADAEQPEPALETSRRKSPVAPAEDNTAEAEVAVVAAVAAPALTAENTAVEEAEAVTTTGSPEAAQADLSGLRSVKSPLLNGGEAKTETRYDDLKRIRGIGVLIEKKLNSLGICRYEQIANWSAAEIDRISQVLDFKGRIERESWVEQARILASGGQTEFSSRLDRG